MSKSYLNYIKLSIVVYFITVGLKYCNKNWRKKVTGCISKKEYDMVSKYLSFNFQNSCYNYLIPVSVHPAVSPISRSSIFIFFVYLFICPLFTFLEIWAKKVRRLEQNLTALASQLVINFLILYGTKMIKL